MISPHLPPPTSKQHLSHSSTSPQHHAFDHQRHSGSPPSLTHLPHNSGTSIIRHLSASSTGSSSPHFPPPPVHSAVAASNAQHQRQLLSEADKQAARIRHQEGYPQQQPQQGGSMLITLEEERRKRRQLEDAEGLSMLCSQHHKSEYNRLKWGDKGGPIYYVPLSIQVPDHVSALMTKQALFESLCSERLFPPTPPSPPPSSHQNGSSDQFKSFQAATQLNDQGESSRALEEEEGLEGLLVADGGVDGQTSENGGVAPTSRPLPDQIRDALSTDIHPPPQPPSRSSSLSSVESAPSTTPFALSNTASSPNQVLHTSADTTTGTVPSFSPSSSATTNGSGPCIPARASGEVFSSIEAGRAKYAGGQNEMQQQQQPGVVVSQPVKTSDTHPINISIIIPPHLIPQLSPLLTLTSFNPPPPLLPTPSPSNPSSPSSVLPSKPFRLPPLIDLYSLAYSSPAVDAVPAAPPLTPPSSGSFLDSLGNGTVGNFLLSSCPGKKVRLTGPVKGRGAICRDLKVDLERIKGLGVGCVICCLDDEELKYLGAPFEEYESIAKLVGLDVIRIPMPEGLTPTSLPSFDAHLHRIITQYTLRGINVLAHCRGGVGRAGLVASSWAIKMGLVAASLSSSHQHPHGGEEGEEEREISFGESGSFTESDLEIVEKVVGVVRRRRSVKAIETFEQVKWLVDYVKWLRVEAQTIGGRC